MPAEKATGSLGKVSEALGTYTLLFRNILARKHSFIRSGQTHCILNFSAK